MGNMITFFVFLFGLCWGSFLNVLIFRFNHGKSPWKGRSFCPKCKKTIGWYDNIPLLSFILLGGRCRECRSPISCWYPVGELLVAGVWVTLFLWLGLEPVSHLIFWLLVSWLLCGVLLSDLRYQTIPEFFTIGLGLCGLVRLFLMQDMGAFLAGLFCAAFFYLLHIGTKKKGMGLGDVQLVLGLGFLLGVRGTIVAMYTAFLVGALFGVALILLGRKKFGQKIAFGPFLVLGAVVAFGWANELVKAWFGLMGGM